MAAPTSKPRHRRLLPLVLAFALCALQAACVMPARIASGVKGSVVDATSGETLEGAVIVVRFEGRYGEVLPDRELLGHREATSNANGNFEVGSIVRAGLSSWPLYKTEARIVSVLKPGYRCPAPHTVQSKQELTIELEPALDLDDQRASCRPVPAKRGEAESYMTAWRELFPGAKTAAVVENERQISRILEARTAFGFGENCSGPVNDLAIAPDGARVGISVASTSTSEIRMVDFSDGSPRGTKIIARDDHSPARRLAWTRLGDLVLWEPAIHSNRSVSSAAFGSDRFEVVWKQERFTPPAKPDFGPKRILKDSRAQHTPLDPADLNDEADTRWHGRRFEILRNLDPETGLSSDRLGVVLQDGTHYEIAVPGEACGPTGRFGRPQFRIVEDGTTAVDLRYVEGACHAVAIDLASGDWRKLDGSKRDSVCSRARHVPASHLNTALRSYSRELHAARVEAGADPTASFAMIIDGSGSTHVETRNHLGEPVRTAVPNFPISTPLRRIDVSLIGGSKRAPKASPPTKRPVRKTPATRDLNPL
jgi:hypothetical protein